MRVVHPTINHIRRKSKCKSIETKDHTVSFIIQSIIIINDIISAPLTNGVCEKVCARDMCVAVANKDYGRSEEKLSQPKDSDCKWGLYSLFYFITTIDSIASVKCQLINKNEFNIEWETFNISQKPNQSRASSHVKSYAVTRTVSNIIYYRHLSCLLFRLGMGNGFSIKMNSVNVCLHFG